MHEMDNGAAVPVVTESLLRGSSASDVCLMCHAQGEYSVFGLDPLMPPNELGAGNFVFLTEDQINDGPGLAIGGHHAGHSIVAPGLGLMPDPDRPHAPGGSFPSSALGCTSCHDPHGNTNFRMLHGAGAIQDGLYSFTYPAPQAEGLPFSIPGLQETPSSHTAYRSGFSDWCANCHGEYHDTVGTANFNHEFDEQLNSDEANRYDNYDGELNPNGGFHLSAYLPEVPFEDSSSEISSTSGPTNSSRVSCITCHRAHATSAPAATRWDMRIPNLGDDGATSGSWPIPNPYDNPQQKQLCLKCHDESHAYQSPRSCVVCHARSAGGPSPFQ
jgi:hypothetical protein